MIAAYLVEFFLEWVMCPEKFMKKIKTHTLFSVTFSPNFLRL